ncbi:serine/threonine-protein kinase [Streptomyces sp. NPDC097619]|uniref:serine/threonine-protein kinase n=1 Tax=Streptomyces sp. NPDC097619 TaxID=3157228 RepID=UPI00331E1E49
MSVHLPGAQPAPAALSAEDPREIGGYRLHARLGSGGMGVVYLAHTPGGRPIALKAVRPEFAADPEFRRRFAQEVASARRIHGFFTAQVVDSGVSDRTPWLATAYVPGPTLHQVVQRHGPLPARSVLLLVAGIAEALEAIHRAGVVHRDLKPANVLLAADGPRVIDFGIARAADAAALTGTGLRIGTAAFMAPEQALGHQATAATDVFALGALAAYVAGGVPPFGSGPETTALYRVVHEHPDLGRVPIELRDLISWCLVKGQAERPAPADLIAAVHGHPALGGRPGFTGDWLPGAVHEEIGAPEAGPPAPGPYGPAGPAMSGGAAGPAGHAPAAAVPGHHHRPTLAAPVGPSAGPAGGAFPTPFPAAFPEPLHGAAPAPHPADAGSAAAPSAPRSDRRARRRSRLLLPAALVAALLACGAAAYWFLPPEGDPEAGGGAPAGSAARYLPGHPTAELTAPDAGYEFDLRAAKVVPEETADWYLARDKEGFLLSEESDAFLADGTGLTPEECVRGIETRPVTVLPFSELEGERAFCVRSPDGREIAVLHLIDGEPQGSVTVSLEHFRRG